MDYTKESLKDHIGQSLKHYRETVLKEKSRDIVARLKSKKISVTKTKISNIESNKGSLLLDTLCPIIKEGYLIDQPFLFLHDPAQFLNKQSNGQNIIQITEDSEHQYTKLRHSQHSKFYDQNLENGKIRIRQLVLETGQDSEEYTVHTTEELAYIHKGERVCFDFKNRVRASLKQGEIIHFGPNILHKAINEGKDTAEIFIFTPKE